ncbi:hypothetical protein [Wenxinia saemankumensis]|uniref:Uncharacterized protein n=1 Tax=Wenxinia saemankumensis TaxID=1447782 RepID=A0A1M6G6L3_9RHOB|nr:hypothetical protein [Wenxinia saemankumensis]SHJ05582.1 hypothetical protein SAMN05444417_2713 [Wenxinia saemankumensis]
MRATAPALLVAAVAALATQLSAQTIPVRSGDHPTFARLVLSIPQGAAWRLGPVEGGYGLRISGPGVAEPDFALGGVFDRIGRDRIARIDPVPGGIDLALACDCHADAFLWRDDRLVLDVVDGPPPAESGFETPLAPAPEAAPDPAAPAPAAAPAPRRNPILPLLPAAALPPGLDPRIVDPPRGVPAAVAPPPTDRAAPADPGETELRLRESIGQAVDAGYLTFADAPPGEAAPDPPPPPAPAEPLLPDRPGLAAHTATEALSPGLAAAAAAFCPPAEALDMTAWTDPDTAFFDGLGPVRAASVTEEGDPSAQGMLDLARYYLAWGFGREAVAALDLAPHPPRHADLLRAMAEVMDDRPRGAVFPAAAGGCPGPAQLWSALIRGDVSDLLPPDRAAAVAAWSDLPSAPQAMLGPRLAHLLLAAGATTEADAVLSRVAEEDLRDPAAESTARAELQMRTEGPAGAVRTLQDATTEPGALTPAALVQLIELSLRGGIPVTEDTISLAEALAQEYRGTPEGAALDVSAIRARSAGGDHAGALHRLSAMDPDLPGREDLTHEILLALTERGDDATFLDIAFRDLPGAADDPARAAISERLVLLGFEDRARQIGAADGTAADAPAPPGGGAVRAGAVEPSPPGRDATKPPPTGAAEPSADLQATAAEGPAQDRTGRIVDPAQADMQDADLPAWVAGDWTGLRRSGDPLLATAAEAVLTPTVPDPDSPPLAARRDLLRQADETRAMIGALLERFPSPEGGEGTTPGPEDPAPPPGG